MKNNYKTIILFDNNSNLPIVIVPLAKGARARGSPNQGTTHN
jgi:hypothetical protein